MKSYRKISIIIGVLFLVALFSCMFGDILIKSIVDAPDYLSNVYSYKSKVITGVLLQLVCAVAVVGIAVLLYPILKKHNEPIALSYVGFRVIESAIIFVSAISILLLIPLSQAYLEAEVPDASAFQASGTLAVSGHYWAFQMVIIVCGVAGFLLCYLLYQTRLIPRFMSVIGIIGYPLSVIAPLLDMFGIIATLEGPGFILYVPGIIFEIILLPIWLIFKGFNSTAIDSE